MTPTNNRILIGRQSIYDQKLNVFAYELLLESGTKKSVLATDTDHEYSDILLNSFLEIGIERLVGPYPAFLNLTPRFFNEVADLAIEPEQVVLELQENTTVSDALVNEIDDMAKRGFKIAITDNDFDPKWTPLLPHIAFIKITADSFDFQKATDIIPGLKKYPLKLLAQNISTEEQFRQLKELGFDYFQGYFFSQPKIIESKKISENGLVILRLLAQLNDPAVTIEELQALIEQDPALSYKILHYINSAAVGLRRTVDSIQQAIVFLGLNTIRTWASLLVMSGVNEGTPNDTITNALVRAYMCRHLLEETGIANADTGFTVGMLSILDVLLQAPLASILSELPLSEDITIALLEYEGIFGEALECTLAFEKHEWHYATFDTLDPDKLNEIYASSSHEAFRASMGLNN